MTIDPAALARLRLKSEEVLGVDDTTALLDPLAQVEWAKLVTTDDLERQIENLRHDLERQINTLRHDLEHQMDTLRSDLEHQIDALRSDLEHQIAVFRTDMIRMFAESEAKTERRIGELQTHLRRDLLLVTGGQFLALVATVAAVLGFG